MADPSDAYWAGAAVGDLVLQRCTACGHVRHYPQTLCPVCQSFDTDHVTASGRGTLYSWTVCHHAFAPDVRDRVPYTLVTVDMDEDVRVLGELSGDTRPRIGLHVTLHFEPRGERPVPVFTAS